MGRNKGNRQTKVNRQSSRPDDYDLKSSLKRLNQRKELEGGSTNSEFESNEYSRNINSSSFESYSGETTGLFLQINDSINSRYDKLKDDISCVSDKIGDSISELRDEIDNKLDKKVNEKHFNGLFYGAVSVLVVIATLIYLLSYTDLIKDSKENRSDLDKNKQELIDVKKEAELQKTRIDRVEEELKSQNKN